MDAPSLRPAFTIFAAGRNCERYAAKCVESVLAQDFSDWQLVLVDDASDDATWQAIDRVIPPDDPRIWRFRRPERRFKLQNFLDFWPCMQGDVLVELDLDDAFAHPRVLSKLARLYQSLPKIDATAGSCSTDFIGAIEGHPGPHVPPPRIWSIGFAVDYPAPRTLRRQLLKRAFSEAPQFVIDPSTGKPYRSAADYVIFAPAIAWARYIHPIDEILVRVTRSNDGNHDFMADENTQYECGRQIRTFWSEYIDRTQGYRMYA